MNEKVLKYLYDIKFAIDEIDSYFVNRTKRFEEYRKELMTTYPTRIFGE